MTSVENLILRALTNAYSLEVEYSLTWFPTNPAAKLKEIRMRGDHFATYTSDFQSHGWDGTGTNHIEHFLDGNIASDYNASDGNPLLGAYFRPDLNSDGIFDLEFDLSIGSLSRRKRLVVPPGTRTPFMITQAVPFPEDKRLQCTSDQLDKCTSDQLVQGTSVVLQGVLTTGSRPTNLVDILRRQP